MQTSFSATENTRICKNHYGWNAETKVVVNGKSWVICTMKRYSGTISTHCHIVQDMGGGSYSFECFQKKEDSFYLNELPKGTKATENTIKAAHYKALAEFDAMQEGGELPDAKTEYAIEVGQVLFSEGHWGQNRRAIYDIEHTQWGVKYKTVYLDGTKTSTDDHIKNIVDKFGIGTYYREGDKITQEEVDELLIVSHLEMQQTAALDEVKKIEAVAAEKDLHENMPKLYPHLTPLAVDKDAQKANLVADLKLHFPGFKFSVTKRDYSSYTISWTDGPTTTEVSKVTAKWEDHATDYSGDYRDYSPSDFNRVFGGFKYIFESRNHTAVYNELLPVMAEMLASVGCTEYPEQILWRVYCRQSFPIGAIITGIERTECTGGSIEEFYRLTFTSPEVKKTPAPVEVAPGSIQIIDYSDKAIAVTGDTKPLREVLSALGGRFNFRLTCGAGWIFSKKKEAEVRTALGL